MALHKVRNFLGSLLSKTETNPRRAYNQWAAGYDNQPGNLMLDLDEAVFSDLLSGIDLRGKIIADIGCGTGRHWEKIYKKKPRSIAGFDVSEEMLKKLKEKFPGVETHLLVSDALPGVKSNSLDAICSTLTIAHIRKIDSALREWHRTLAVGGDIIITDYHPAILQKGGQRTFMYEGRLVAVKNYIHPVDTIREIARQLHLREIRFIEKLIDESVKAYYENQGAMPVYEKYKGEPVIYGIHFKKD